jgi:hypothetical protein
VAPPLPLGVVRLGDVDGDQAVVVSGQNGGAAGRILRRIGQKVEG